MGCCVVGSAEEEAADGSNEENPSALNGLNIWAIWAAEQEAHALTVNTIMDNPMSIHATVHPNFELWAIIHYRIKILLRIYCIIC